MNAAELLAQGSLVFGAKGLEEVDFGGRALAQVRDLLGHASITTTERYDNQTVANLQIAAAKLERGQIFAPSAVKVSRFFQDRPVASGSRTPRARPSDEGKALQEMHLSGWLGRRDSNPDNHVQSVVSYR